MRYICDNCSGSGWVTDQDGHIDVCERCWGLGYIEETEQPKPVADQGNLKAIRRIQRNAAIILASVVGVIYLVLYFFSTIFTYTILDLIIIFFTSYYIGILISNLYARRAMKRLSSKSTNTKNEHT
ncbi:hypothetical protein ApAK_03220 [Thermoplasmatales archaeon AK]|nr:hypothetical protein [Thermoplasmatales archaeon AK]